MTTDVLKDVSRETLEKLKEFEHLVAKWTRTINLVAPGTVSNLWERHILDSAQIYHAAPEGWTRWIDIGSGGGFPGLVIAIMDQDSRHIDLIESDTRKALFLKTVRRELGLSVEVHADRIEACDLQPADVVSARALAPLKDLLTHAERLLAKNGTALFPKGQRYKEELDQALQTWQFDTDAIVSNTNENARILKLSRISRREP